MGALAAAIPVISTVATIGSAVVGAGAAIYSGSLQQQAANQTATNLQDQGKAQFAVAQQAAAQQKLEGQYLMSSQQAQAAASGGGAGADAPTITRLMETTAQRTEYASDNAEFSGEEDEMRYNDAANAERQTGSDNFLGGFVGGLGDLISGAGSYARLKQQGIAY